MEAISRASQEYLRQEKNLGNAILHLTLSESGKSFILETYEQDKDGNCSTPFSFKAARFVPNRFEHGYRQTQRKGCYHPIYEVPITDYTVDLVNHAWKNPKIISDLAKPFFQSIFLREFVAEQNAIRVQNWTTSGFIPTSEWFDSQDILLSQRDISLNAYQKLAAFNACQVRQYALLADPGLGKTAIMIRKLDYVAQHAGRQTLSIVLCPKSIRRNWISELVKFATSKIHVVLINGGSANARTIKFMEDVSTAPPDSHVVIVCNYEAFVGTEAFRNLEYDLCLLDECHNIADIKTKRTKALLEARDKFRNVIEASGTFFRNSPFDAFSQLEFLGKAFSGFASYEAFKRFYGEYTKGYNGMRQLTAYQNIPLLQEKLAKHAFIIKKEQALPFLPKKTFSIRECTLTTEQSEAYASLCSALSCEIESYGPEPDTITVTNILTQMLRLAQITSGFAKLDSGAVNRFDPNPKLDLLCRMLLNSPEYHDYNDEEEDGILVGDEGINRKALVWCAFKENLHTIRARLELEGIKSVVFSGALSDEERNDAVISYNCDRDVRVFIGIAASGGVGLNLVGFDPANPKAYETNTTDNIYFSSNWSQVHRLQSQDRGHRFITRVPLHITDLIVPGTIDMEIYSRVMAKIQMSLSISDIRKILVSFALHA